MGRGTQLTDKAHGSLTYWVMLHGHELQLAFIHSILRFKCLLKGTRGKPTIFFVYGSSCVVFYQCPTAHLLPVHVGSRVQCILRAGWGGFGALSLKFFFTALDVTHLAKCLWYHILLCHLSRAQSLHHTFPELPTSSHLTTQ